MSQASNLSRLLEFIQRWEGNLHRCKWSFLLAAVILSAATWALYGGALSIGYLSDDYDLISAVTSSDFSIWDSFPAGRGTYFRPLTTLSLYLEQHIPVIDPLIVHHLSNLSVLTLTGLLIYLIGISLTGRFLLSLGLSLMTIAHPANVTNAFWISGRTTLLATLFYTTAILTFVLYLRSGRKRWLLFSTFALCAALLSKETSVTLVVALGLIFVLVKGWGTRSLPVDISMQYWVGRSLAVMLILTIVYLLYVYLRFYSQPGVSLGINIRQALETIVTFPVLYFLPNRQSLLIQLYRNRPGVLILGSALMVLGLIAVAFMLLKRFQKRDLLLIAILLLMPVISIIPFVLFVGGIDSRLMFLPLALTCVSLAGWALAQPNAVWPMTMVIYPLVLLAMFVSKFDGSTWIENWRLTQAYCQDLKTLTAEDLNLENAIFLTIPSVSQDVPLYANDFNRALFYCLNGNFGNYPGMYWYGSIDFDGDGLAKDSVVVDFIPLATINITLPIPDAFFLFPGDPHVGDQFSSPTETITITSLRKDGRVNGFALDFFDPRIFDHGNIYYFDGGQFQKFEQSED